MQKYLYLFLLLVFTSKACLYAQASKSLTLNKALELAQKQSLQAVLNKHNYLTEYWEYKSYLASQRPAISLKTNPLSYTSASNLRYNSLTQTEEYVQTENINSDINLSLEQNIAATGGKLFLSSAMNRIENFGLNAYKQYASVPFQVGYSQNISSYNPLKWQKKIAPIQYKRAQKQFIESKEAINQQVCSLFFTLAEVQVGFQIAQSNLTNTQNLLKIAQQRLLLGTVTQAEVLDLELSLNNSKIDLQTKEVLYREAYENFMYFLNLPPTVPVQIVLPKNYPLVTVDQQQVVQIALANNPSLLQQQELVLKSQQELLRAKSQRYLQAEVFVSYGVSKTDGSPESPGTAMGSLQPNFDKYKRLQVGITIPLLDWGKAKGNYQVALSKQRIAELTAKQTQQQFEQSVRTFVTTFNLQQSKNTAAIHSDSLARKSYELTLAYFRRGKADVLRVTNSQAAKDKAKLHYILTLASYWQAYYKLRKLTLYDFIQQQPLSLPSVNN